MENTATRTPDFYESRRYFDLLHKIVKRAKGMNIGRGTKITQMMDIDHAARQFNIRLEDWLNGSDFNFAHDYIGIQSCINRESGLVEGLFVPRYSGRMTLEEGAVNA